MAHFIDDSKIRKAVGIIVVNKQKKVLIGKRIKREDISEEKLWQLPQGGIDHSELPLDAAFREMKEEIGTNKVELITESSQWYTYHFPQELQEKFWFQGQQLKWFLFSFTGTDRDINIQTDHPEFSQWKWEEFDEVINLIIPFKKEMYRAVWQEFKFFFSKI